MMNRRNTLGALGAILLGAAGATAAPWARAQQATRIMVGATPGGGTDLVARTLAAALVQRTDHQFVVDNKPGAGGNIAAQLVSRAAPDGQTLLLSYTSHVINPSLYSNLPFDPVADFTPLAGVARLPAMLVANPALPANNVRELIALAKSRPGKLNIAVAGLGSSNQLAGEMLKLKAGIDIVGVPYKGTGPALQDVVAGQIQLAIAGVASAQQLVRAGKIKALGVTSAQRVEEFPEVAAIGETLADFDFSSWYGLFGPAGMEPAVARRLSDATLAALQSPEMKKRFRTEGIVPMGLGGDEFAAFVRSEIKRWGDVVVATGVKVQ